MFRKRRRPKPTWFPLLGYSYAQGTTTPLNSWVVRGKIPIGNDPNEGEALEVRPLIWDAPFESAAAGSSDAAHQLVDFVGNEYTLFRVVGKFFAHINPESVDSGGPDAFQVTMGLFVARADDASGGTAGVDQPVGFGNPDSPALYSPDHLDTAREPWIWRRRWILGNEFGPSATGAEFFPATTVQGAGIFDGPHVDAKMKRRIGNDDRLWMAVSVKPYPLGFDFTASTPGNYGLEYTFDARVLGTLRKAKNRSAF